LRNVALFADDIAEIDADAEFDTPVGWDAGVAHGHLALKLNGAAHRIDDAGELGQQAVAGGRDDVSTVLVDLGIDEFAAMCLQPGERALLVGSHQPAVAGHIGGQDGRKPPLHPFASQAYHSLSTCDKILVAAQ
jgi:hypothetical protein